MPGPEQSEEDNEIDNAQGNGAPGAGSTGSERSGTGSCTPALEVSLNNNPDNTSGLGVPTMTGCCTSLSVWATTRNEQSDSHPEFPPTVRGLT